MHKKHKSKTRKFSVSAVPDRQKADFHTKGRRAVAAGGGTRLGKKGEARDRLNMAKADEGTANHRNAVACSSKEENFKKEEKPQRGRKKEVKEQQTPATKRKNTWAN